MHEQLSRPKEISTEESLLTQGNEIQARMITRQNLIESLIKAQNQDRALAGSVREQLRLTQKRRTRKL